MTCPCSWLSVAAAFSLRDGIDELIHPSVTQSFTVAYVVLAISAVCDLVSFRGSVGQMARRARRYHREFLVESRVTSESSLRAVFRVGLELPHELDGLPAAALQAAA